MRPFHGLHEMGAGLVTSVCLSVFPDVHMFKLENSWADFAKTWYEYGATGGHPSSYILI
jgi:hypothetical protein